MPDLRDPSDPVWEEVGAVASMERGFDGNRVWLSQFAVPIGVRRDELSRPLVEEDVLGSFAAIEALAWHARTLSSDPENRERVSAIAEEISLMAGTLVLALDWTYKEPR